MYYLNKIIGAFLNPLGIGLLLLLVAAGLKGLKGLRGWLVVVSIVWLWFWSTGAVACWLGLSLEREFPPQLAEAMPSADAIIVLGGGMAVETNRCPYADMQSAADRAWHGARLYKAGKAPKVFVTCEADALLLVDMGVPRSAIQGPSGARNTEEEARFIAGAMKREVTVRGEGEQRNCSSSSVDQHNEKANHHCSPSPPTFTSARPKVLLVTSAWHMRRAKLMFDRYAAGVEVVPAAADHMSLTLFARPLEFKDFMPDPLMLGQNAFLFKEVIGYYGYYFLRR